jgi:hypothetical protein
VRLFCDDLRRAPDNTWTIARTNTEAIRLLASGYVDEEISIDHDICVPFSGELSEPVRRRLQIGQETFMPIVFYIIAMKPEDRPKKITIHTANNIAGERMLAMLEDAGIEAEYKESNNEIDLTEDEI